MTKLIRVNEKDYQTIKDESKIDGVPIRLIVKKLLEMREDLQKRQSDDFRKAHIQ